MLVCFWLAAQIAKEEKKEATKWDAPAENKEGKRITLQHVDSFVPQGVSFKSKAVLNSFESLFWQDLALKSIQRKSAPICSHISVIVSIHLEIISKVSDLCSFTYRKSQSDWKQINVKDC